MHIRVLGLGNDLLADDAFGLLMAQMLEECLPADVEIVRSAAAGLALLDGLEGASHVLLLDTWRRQGPAGSVYCLVHQMATGESPGAFLDACLPRVTVSPHYVGLADALRLGWRVGARMPTHLAVIAVEPEDCRTLGGTMSNAVRAALPEALETARRVVEVWREAELQ